MTPRPKTRWLLYWIVGLGVFAFGIPEAAAVIDPQTGDTLSETTAWAADAVPGGRVLLVLFLATLAWHFTAGKGRSWPWRRK